MPRQRTSRTLRKPLKSPFSLRYRPGTSTITIASVTSLFSPGHHIEYSRFNDYHTSLYTSNTHLVENLNPLHAYQLYQKYQYTQQPSAASTIKDQAAKTSFHLFGQRLPQSRSSSFILVVAKSGYSYHLHHLRQIT